LGLDSLLGGADEGVLDKDGGVEGTAPTGAKTSGFEVEAPLLTAASIPNSFGLATDACLRDTPPSVPNFFDVNHDERRLGSVGGLGLSPLMEMTGTELKASDRPTPSPLEGDDEGGKLSDNSSSDRTPLNPGVSGPCLSDVSTTGVCSFRTASGKIPPRVL
jgi:hypothetical protein